jgi:hypothetical protein
MKTYRIINNQDGNDCFNVKAENEEDAAFVALAELGWGVVLPQDEEEKNVDQYEFDF